jgi:murein DD-endopeptidase MepM/ murein hydrolase activator NlpD
MRFSLLLPLLLGLAACRTPRQFEADKLAQERALQRQQELERQRRMERTQLLIEDTESQVSDVRRELVSIQSDLTAKASNRDLQTLERRIAALEEQLARLETQRARDREEIINVLSQRMAELMASRPAAGGRTHTVARGETLSAIAAAYGVSSRAIIQANSISNPNALRIGQELVIPGN